MIVERLVFQVKYGEDLVSVIKEGQGFLPKYGYSPGRLLTDLSGDMFTVVWEREWESLQQWDQARQKAFTAAEFRPWFTKMKAVTEHGRREFYTVA